MLFEEVLKQLWANVSTDILKIYDGWPKVKFEVRSNAVIVSEGIEFKSEDLICAMQYLFITDFNPF